MGEASKRLRQRMARRTRGASAKKLPRQPEGPLPGGIKDIATLIKEGRDPVHALYVFLQQGTSHFAELVSQYPEMQAWTETVAAAEDEYMPSGPPMSPLTGSFFWTWALYDLPIGDNDDTMASCQMDANDFLQSNQYQMLAMRNFAASRMGIYEHVGFVDQFVKLKELITDEEFTCLSAAGYRGCAGELWYVRLLPSPEPELAPFHLAFTTPYVLTEATKADWTSYLRRALSSYASSGCGSALYRLLKYGPQPRYWHEFVFQAYHHHQSDAIFLAGIPDLMATLPHA